MNKLEGMFFYKNSAGGIILKTPNISDKEKAQNLRKYWVEVYEAFPIYGFGGCFDNQRQDAEYNLRAYKIMTDEQILMSEKRANEIGWKDFEERWKKLMELDECQKRITKGKINIVEYAA